MGRKGSKKRKKNKSAGAQQSQQRKPNETGKDTAGVSAPKETQHSKKPTVLEAATTGAIWVLRTTIVIVGLAASLLALHQLYLTEPEIQPVNIGTRASFQMVFTLHNPLLFTMHDTVIAGLLGTIASKVDLSKKLEPITRGPCQRLLAFSSLTDRRIKMSAGNFEVLGTLAPAANATFTTGRFVGGNAPRLLYAVAVTYRLKFLGVTLRDRTVCREFQSFRDPEGRSHIVPN